MPLTLPVLWKLGKRSIPTLAPCSFVILRTLILRSFNSFNTLNCFVVRSFPFCETLLSFVAGRNVLRAFQPADKREKKTSVRSESEDGIPKFWSVRENLRKAAVKPSDRKHSGTWRFSVRSTFARKNVLPP